MTTPSVKTPVPGPSLLDGDPATLLAPLDTFARRHLGPSGLDLERMLEVLGVPVDTAADGLEALTKWREQSYALVLTDIHMPDMDGFELTRQIRAEEALTRSARRTCASAAPGRRPRRCSGCSSRRCRPPRCRRRAASSSRSPRPACRRCPRA